jgi:hypothetical protein
MQEQYIRRIDRQLINEEDTSPRVSTGDLKTETESEIIAIIATPDEAIQTKYHAKTSIAYRNREQILDSVLR